MATNIGTSGIQDLENQNASNRQALAGAGGGVPPGTPPQAPPSPIPPGGVRGLLTKFFQGMGASMMNSGGALDAYNKVAETQYKQAATQQAAAATQQTQVATQGQQLQNAFTARRLQMIQQMQSGNLGSDIVAPLGELAPHEQATLGAAKAEAAMKGDMSPIFDAVKQIGGQRAIWGRATRGDVPITPQMAKQWNIPGDFVGKPINASQIAGLMRGEAFNTVYANTASGPVIIPKTGPTAGQAMPVTINNKPIASNQEAGAYWQAKYGVVKAVDDQGNPVFMRRLDAPGAAPEVGALQIMKGKAGLDNYKDALTRVNDNLDVMDDPQQRAVIARTMRSVGTIHDPGIIASTIGNAISQGLSPKAADLTAAMLQAKEFIGANRQFAGNFTGSEALYQRMVGNVPGPMNSAALNRALIQQDLANTARIEQKMASFQAGANNKTNNQGGQSQPAAPSSFESKWGKYKK